MGVWATVLEPVDGPFMQIDADHIAIGRAFAVDLGIVADAGAALDELLARAAERPVPDSARRPARVHRTVKDDRRPPPRSRRRARPARSTPAR